MLKHIKIIASAIFVLTVAVEISASASPRANRTVIRHRTHSLSSRGSILTGKIIHVDARNIIVQDASHTRWFVSRNRLAKNYKLVAGRTVRLQLKS